jgi:PAS domain S-box-containing protein
VLSEAVLVVDGQGTITFANEAVEALLGWAPADLRRQPVITIIPERLRSAHRVGFGRFTASGEGRIIGRPVRLPALHRDGREVDVELLVSRGVKPGTVVGTLRDLRERVDLEAHTAVTHELVRVLAELRRDESAAPRVLEATAEAIGWDAAGLWSVERGSRRLRCDAFWTRDRPELARFAHVSAGTLLPVGVGLPGRVWESGEPAWIVRVAEDRNFPRGAAAAASGIETAFAVPVVSGGEFVAVLELFDRNVRSEDRSLMEAMIGVAELIGQILERSRYDDERNHLLGRLQTERARLEAVQRRMPAGVLVADAPSGRVVAGNDRLESLVGPPVPSTLDGETVLDYPFRHPDGRPYEDHELPFVQSARTAARTDDVELTLLGADGEIHLVSVSSAPIVDAQGTVISSVATFHDVTARRRAEERHRFLSQASAALVGTLDHAAALQQVAALAIGVLGDTVGVYLLDPDGILHESAIAHRDPRTAEVHQIVRDRYGYDEEAAEGVARVLRTGETVLYDAVDPDLLSSVAKDEEHLALLLELPNRSALLIPVIGRREVLGVLTFLSARSAHVFDPDTVMVAEELGRRVGIAVENARLYERERAIAATLQASLLPQRMPDLGWVDLGARFQAGGAGLEVGGDCYDAFTLDEGVLALLIGDVCGKGAEAAARTAQLRYTMKAMSSPGRDPAEVLALVDATVGPFDLPNERYCTAVYAQLARTEGGALRCTAASGGHPLPLVVRGDGRVEELPCPGTLLFVLRRAHHRSTATTLAPGDALVLYTDGVTEARGDGWFGVDRLRRVLSEAAGRSAQEMADAIVDAALDFGGGHAADDLAVLVARCP